MERSNGASQGRIPPPRERNRRTISFESPMRYFGLFLSLSLAFSTAGQDQPPAQPPEIQAAIDLLEAGDLNGAIRSLEQSSASRGQNQARIFLGTLYLQDDRAQESYDLLAPMAEDAAAEPALLYQAGRASLAVGKLDEADNFLTRSVEIASISPATRELGFLRGRQGRGLESYALLRPWALLNPEDHEARLAAAWLAMELERPAEAEALLSDLPQTEPRVRMLWARLLLQQGNPQATISTLAPLTAQLDSLPASLRHDHKLLMAEAYIESNRPSQALGELGDLTPRKPAVALLKARALNGTGDGKNAAKVLEPFAEALEEQDPAIGERNLGADLVFEYGRTLEALGDLDGAAKWLRRTVMIVPWYTEAWHLLGDVLNSTGHGSEAEEARSIAKQLAEAKPMAGVTPMDPTGWVVQEAQQWILLGNPELAMKMVEREIRLAPEDLRPRLLEFQTLMREKKFAEAKESAHRTVELAPDNADAMYQVGVVNLLSGSIPEGEAALRKTIELSAEHVAAMNDLAMLLIRQGRNEEARPILDKILILQPDNEAVREVRSRLDG